MKFQILLCAFLVSCSLAEARLFESRLELTQRFGTFTKVPGTGSYKSEQYRFSKDGWTINAWLINDECHCITYHVPTSAHLSAEQMAAVMTSNASDGKWEEVTETSTAILMLPFRQYLIRKFVRSDKAAWCSKLASSITFTSSRWERFKKDAEDARITKREAVPSF